jgi:hypothetical protein
MAEVLAPFWPRDRELTVSEPAFFAVLSQFTELKAVLVELADFGAQGSDVSALALNQQLRSVTLTGCVADLDLSPLSRLPLLETIILECRDRLPDLNPLSTVRGLRTLRLVCRSAGDSLGAIARVPGVNSLELRGFNDVTDFSDVWLPQPLEDLTLSGFTGLRSLSGFERLDTLKALELFECPQLLDLSPITEMKSLEALGIGVIQMNAVDLSPLTELPRLKELALLGYADFNLTALRGKRDIVIRVPAGSTATGAEGLGYGSSVTDFESPPRTQITPFGEGRMWTSG